MLIPFHAAKILAHRERRYIFQFKDNIEENELTLLDICTPPEQGPELMAKLVTLITSEAIGRTIIGGDLNLVMGLDCQVKEGTFYILALKFKKRY